jgi:nitrogen regulatory protein P-II 2
MKLIIAILQPHQLPEVKRALYRARIYHLTCTNILGTVANQGERHTFRGVEHEVTLFQKIRVEFPVNDAYVEAAIDAIVQGGRASGGAGRIFVTELHEAVEVLTGERGPAIVQEQSPAVPDPSPEPRS